VAVLKGTQRSNFSYFAIMLMQIDCFLDLPFVVFADFDFKAYFDLFYFIKIAHYILLLFIAIKCILQIS
jgi:hypothetical protein